MDPATPARIDPRALRAGLWLVLWGTLINAFDIAVNTGDTSVDLVNDVVGSIILLVGIRHMARAAPRTTTGPGLSWAVAGAVGSLVLGLAGFFPPLGREYPAITWLLHMLGTAGIVGQCWATARIAAASGWTDLTRSWRACGWWQVAPAVAGGALAALGPDLSGGLVVLIVVVGLATFAYFVICVWRTLGRLHPSRSDRHQPPSVG